MLPLYQDPEHEALWRQNPDLYRVFTRRLISEGNPTRAFDIAREGLAAHADDHELKYLLALALARGGNLRGAEKYLADLLQQSGLLGLSEEPTAPPVRRQKGTVHTLRRSDAGGP